MDAWEPAAGVEINMWDIKLAFRDRRLEQMRAEETGILTRAARQGLQQAADASGPLHLSEAWRTAVHSVLRMEAGNCCYLVEPWNNAINEEADGLRWLRPFVMVFQCTAGRAPARSLQIVLVVLGGPRCSRETFSDMEATLGDVHAFLAAKEHAADQLAYLLYRGAHFVWGLHRRGQPPSRRCDEPSSTPANPLPTRRCSNSTSTSPPSHFDRFCSDSCCAFVGMGTRQCPRDPAILAAFD
ncbi:uncharacterized protein LOC129598320 [Paramacrobiotus metropolitanus]|uniref:uncharacterized protein LOC129598320 n=1 Tax=Paramacrobiotus metropolitanus TaxID=2943436 RepID=UPI0024459E64|nr:uncharacterized protein LOC129598320 [Paramacrobiotus metropolitanus]